jgi:hypothetical protein
MGCLLPGYENAQKKMGTSRIVFEKGRAGQERHQEPGFCCNFIRALLAVYQAVRVDIA